MSAMPIRETFGALLLGGVFASLLSGFVIVQVVVFFKLYPVDPSIRLKTLVLSIWFLDTCHTIFIWIAMWDYFIDYYGNFSEIYNIKWSVALTVQFTAIVTFLVHLFFAQRIFKLSRRNYILTAPIAILALLRLVAATVSTAFMLHLHTLPRFRKDVESVFTIGLVLSSVVDVLITVSLFVLLHTSRTGAATLDVTIDALIRYTFETASLTCAGTIASMLCWTLMDNLIFMGLHFVIGKLYANSLLVTLNTRGTIRRRRPPGSVLRINNNNNNISEHRRHKSQPSEEFMIPSMSHDLDAKKNNEERVQVEVVVERSVLRSEHV